jgi:hypothetical protein
MTVKTKISDGLIDQITLYRPLFWLFRWDVLPFLVIYALSTYLIVQESEWKFPALILFPVGLCLQLFVFLLAQSSVAFRCFIGKKQVTDIDTAVDVHVRAAKNAGKDRLVNLFRMRGGSQVSNPGSVDVLGQSFALTNEMFIFQEVMYCFSRDKGCFSRINYPVSFRDNNFLLKWKGYEHEESVFSAFRRWGINEFNIPMPHFLDLYMVNCVFTIVIAFL